MSNIDDFDFALPPELIAQHPAPERSASRLLHVAGKRLADMQCTDLPGLLAAGDLLVFNDTRVIHARLFGVKESGGKVEVLIERVLDAHRALAQVRASKTPKAGSRLIIEEAFVLRVLARAGANEEFFLLELVAKESAAADERGRDERGNKDLAALIERHGHLPLPPYIEHPAVGADEERYQTVFARTPGAVAAPTAGLHFDPPLLSALTARGVEFAWLTLHVGAGTFQPVRVQRLEDHRMHRERYTIPQETVDLIARTRANGGRIVAVGTTALRALEAGAARSSAAGKISGLPAAGSAETDIFITPGFRFQVVDRLLTNFHLPKSTLLMLVCAFAGIENIRHAYAHAIREAYRFFSYGDAMLLEKNHDL